MIDQALLRKLTAIESAYLAGDIDIEVFEHMVGKALVGRGPETITNVDFALARRETQ